jgi:hypothetical protein
MKVITRTVTGIRGPQAVRYTPPRTYGRPRCSRCQRIATHHCQHGTLYCDACLKLAQQDNVQCEFERIATNA